MKVELCTDNAWCMCAKCAQLRADERDARGFWEDPARLKIDVDAQLLGSLTLPEKVVASIAVAKYRKDQREVA